MKRMKFTILFLAIVVFACGQDPEQWLPGLTKLDTAQYIEQASAPDSPVSGFFLNVNGYPLWYDGVNWDTLNVGTYSGGGGVTDHGLLLGLSGDDHTQYHTTGRANTWFTTKDLVNLAGKSHTDLSDIGTLTHARIEDSLAIRLDTSQAHNLRLIDLETDVPANTTAIALNTTHRGLTNNPHSVDDVDVLPSMTGNSGKYLTTDGSASLWASVSSGGAGGDTTHFHTDTISEFTADQGLLIDGLHIENAAIDVGAWEATIITPTYGGTGLSSIATLLNSNTTKTDVGLPNVENIAISTWVGSTNITTLGTIATGVWNGTDIADADVANDITLTNITQVTNRSHTDLSDVGTLTHAEIEDSLAIRLDTAQAHNLRLIDLETDVATNTTGIAALVTITDSSYASMSIGTINEYTATSGVTIDGLVIKDGGIEYIDDTTYAHNQRLLELEATLNDSLVLDSVAWMLSDTIPFAFTLGSNQAFDTLLWVDGVPMNSFFNQQDTIVALKIIENCFGAGGNYSFRIVYSTTYLDGSPTVIYSGSITTAAGEETSTTFTNNKVPPEVHIWCEVDGTPTGKARHSKIDFLYAKTR